jgi:predicted RNase H-like HicB family nuclease
MKVFSPLCSFPLPLREGLGEGYNIFMTKKKSKTYLVNQVKEKMAKYLTVSEQYLKKDLREAWKDEYSVIIEKDEDGFFVASVPALPGCHTQAKTLPELRKRVKDAIKLCLSVAEKDLQYQKQIKMMSYQPKFVSMETIAI